MNDMENTTPTTAIDTALLARVKALGTYDPDGADEDHDRARTSPCSATYVELDDAWITIYSNQYGVKEGYVEPRNAPPVTLNEPTMRAILDALDDANFPYWPE